MAVHYFGIRHHGPGCARSLRAALEDLDPDLLLIEGPPEAEALLGWAGHPDIKPPVALMLYVADRPQASIFYPFAEYSPEWQALRWAHPRQVGVRFIDMPAGTTLALAEEPAADEAPAKVDAEEAPVEESAEAPAEEPEHFDGLALLAEAAGFSDHELWWEHEIERRLHARDLFEGIREAMTAVRAEAPPPSEREAAREAFMRRAVRSAVQDGYQRIAVVCGAWHVPALLEPVKVKDDAERVKGLPRLKVVVAWVPWTNQRLSWRSGYGAGVEAPGWYEHLWSAPDKAAIAWLAESARLLRGEDLDAPPASVIEAVRLADCLATLRDLRAPGLPELREATRTVLCLGRGEPVALIRERLEIGRGLGVVPQEAPALPIQRDFESQVKSLRLKKSDGVHQLDLDLRKDLDLARSHFLHRLRTLSISWAAPLQVGGKAGTFHELWNLVWKPEIEVSLVEASLWGQSIAAAAAQRLEEKARKANLPALTGLLDEAILASLTPAIESLLRAVQEQAAIAADVDALMKALPPLARVSRYGSVRGTNNEYLEPILVGLFERAMAGLTPACLSLDDAAANLRLESLQEVEGAIDLLEREDWREELLAAWARLAGIDTIHGLLRGYACRALLEAGTLEEEGLQRLVGLALSPATPPASAAAWVEGLLRGNSIHLLHRDSLWQSLDAWLVSLPSESFQEQLPLLRRAFARFGNSERRAMGEKVKKLNLATPEAVASAPSGLDTQRADRVLPILATILGVRRHE